jgi:hypothetical protein
MVNSMGWQSKTSLLTASTYQPAERPTGVSRARKAHPASHFTFVRGVPVVRSRCSGVECGRQWWLTAASVHIADVYVAHGSVVCVSDSVGMQWPRTIDNIVQPLVKERRIAFHRKYHGSQTIVAGAGHSGRGQ